MYAGQPYFSCSNLEAGFVCYTADVASCCWDDRPIRIPAEQKEIGALIDEYLLARKLIIQQNQGEAPPCRKCPILRPCQPGDGLFHFLNFSSYAYCNYSCFECSRIADKAIHPDRYKTEPYDCLEIGNELKRRGLLAKDLHIYCSPGEITVHPRRNAIYDFIEENARSVSFYINGSKFDERLAKILGSSANNVAIISLDAGTAETYSLIKSVNSDLFSTVISNLKRYREYSPNIVLKYILFENKNCNNTDYLNFIQICKEIDVYSMDISANKYRHKNPHEPEDYIVNALYCFFSGAIKNNIKLSFVHGRMIGKTNLEAVSRKILDLPELTPIEERFDAAFSAQRLICYGAGAKSGEFLKRIEALGLRKPDVLWDMKAASARDPMTHLGYPVEAPAFDTLDPNRDAVFISIANQRVNQELIHSMRAHGFDRVISQYDAALAITLKGIRKYGSDDLGLI